METSMQAPAQAPPQDQSTQPMVFDSQPVTAPTPVPATGPATNSGMTFDAQPTTTAITVPDSPASPTAPTTGLQKAVSYLHGDYDPGGADNNWYPELGDELSGALKSGANGLGGVLDLINYHGRQQPSSQHIQDLSNWLHSAGQPEGFWQNVGGLGEQALEWLGTDGLLKLASAPAKTAAVTTAASKVGQLAQAQKVATVLAENPRLAGLLTIGLKASKDAVMAGTQNYLHTEDAGNAAETGAVAGALSGTLRGGSALVQQGVKAIRQATDSGAVQDALQSTIRGILGNVADAHGVAKPVSASVRDVFSELGDSLAAKAQGMYQRLDQALTTEGGSVQQNYKTFDQQIRNVRREISLDTGIDPDRSGALLEREAALVDAKQKAIADAASKGVPWDTGPKADALWKTSKALQDVQTAINQAAIGLRPELAVTGKAATVAAPEEITGTFAKKLNALYTSGRLADALSPNHADDLLRAAEVASLQARKVLAARKLVGTAAKTLAAGAGAGAAVAGWEGLKHILDQSK